MAQRKNVGNVRHLRSWGLGSLSVSLPFFQLVLPVSLSSIFRLSVSHLPDILLSHVLPVSLPPISKSPCVLSSCILKKHCCDESVKWHDMVTCNTSIKNMTRAHCSALMTGDMRWETEVWRQGVGAPKGDPPPCTVMLKIPYIFVSHHLTPSHFSSFPTPRQASFFVLMVNDAVTH